MLHLARGTVDFALAVVACGVVLAVLGLPVRWWLTPRRPDPFGLETMLMGRAVFGVFAWWWSRIGTGGMRRGMPLLVALTVLALVVSGWRTRVPGEWWRGGGPGRAGGGAVRIAVLLAIVLLLCGLHMPGFFTQAHVGPASAGNNDLPYYALNARHLARHNFGDRSEVVTWDLGEQAKNDVAGAFLFVAGVSSATGMAAWRVTEATIGLGLLLLLAALAQLVGALGVRGRAAGVVVASLAILSGTFFYSVLHGYVAWGLTLGAMVLVLALAAEVVDAEDAAARRAPVLVASLATTWCYLVYPHVVFFFLPFALGLVVMRAIGWAASVREARARLRTSLVAVLVPFVLPVVLIPDRWVISVHRTFLLGGTTAGWKLGHVRLGQWLGVARFPDGPTGRAASVFGGPGLARRVTVLAGALVLAVIAVFVVVLVLRLVQPGAERADWLSLLLAVVAPIALYEVLYRRYGELYQAWKAVTYLQPLVVAGLLIVGWRVVRVAAGASNSSLAVAGGVAAAVSLAAVTIGAAQPRSNVLPLRLSDDHLALGRVVRQFRIDAVNIDITPGPAMYWDTMWAMYFLDDATIYPLQETYMPKTTPHAKWTLRTADSPVPAGVTRHRVSARFVLDRTP